MRVEAALPGQYRIGDVIKGSMTLLTRAQNAENPEYINVYRMNGNSKLELPLMTEEQIFNDMWEVIKKRNIKEMKAVTYWDNIPYTGREILLTCVQFFDFHNVPLPNSTLPPSKDIKDFIFRVKSINKKVNVVDQFELLLDIANDNVVGAANLGMMSTRIMSRGVDKRAYPDIDIKPKDILEWNKKVCQFETYQENTADGPGDNYYFWTHFFAASAYRLMDDVVHKHKLLDIGFSNGTKIMTLIRPTISSHSEASIIGRNIGLALSESTNSKYCGDIIS